ncbi:MAG: hypothetical protein EPN85_13465 [Bacteroidetes bacterium]|nr:MAG: hypothetical protein EPN85_13465 [Bacteroidota bacterium]
MKKLVSFSIALIIVTSAFTGIAQRYGNVPKVAASNPCSDFHRKACLRSPDEGFSYNGQSRSGLFSKGQQSTVKAVFYKGMDYHISVCTEDEVQAQFIIKDARTGEVLYDNSTDNNTQEIQISNVSTRNVNILVVLPGGEGEKEKGKKDMVKGQEGVCAGIMVEHRRSDKTGF